MYVVGIPPKLRTPPYSGPVGEKWVKGRGHHEVGEGPVIPHVLSHARAGEMLIPAV